MISFLNLLVVISSLQAVQPVIVKTPEMELHFTPRSANQMGSFYEARGFPKAMRDILKQQCFVTVGIQNNSKDKIWLDLANWEFSVNGETIKRETRAYWKARWQAMDMPLNKQSTFRWTLIPESLDYLPGEHEGGNIILPFTKGFFTVEATFATGENKQGTPIIITTDKLFCAEDAQ